MYNYTGLNSFKGSDWFPNSINIMPPTVFLNLGFNDTMISNSKIVSFKAIV